MQLMGGFSNSSELTFGASEPADLLRPPPRQWPAAVLAMVVFGTLSVAAGILSEGFLEADACTHYLYSRFAADQPPLLVDVWGRPFCTIIYMLPAMLGARAGVRIFSMLMAVAIALITMRIARNQGYRRPALAMIFLLGQPLIFLHSFSELTELPFALLIALALWAYQVRNWWALAILVGLMPTSRPEGFGFIALAAVALVLHRRWYLLPILLVPVAAWNCTGWVMYGKVGSWWRWLIDQWPYAGQSLYTPGYLIHFLIMLPAIVSPVAFPALWLGVWRSLRGPADEPLVISACFKAFFGPDHRLRVQWVIVLTALGILAGHSLLYWAGRMASNGELRYMLVVSPMWALLAAAGWEWAFDRFNWRWPALWAGVGVLLSVLSNAKYPVIPLDLSPEARRAKEVAGWYADHPWQKGYPRVLATCRDLYYFIDRSPNDPKGSAYWNRRTIDNDQKGIILVWDPIYGLFNADKECSIPIAELRQKGWVPVHVFPAKSDAAGGDTAIERLARTMHVHGVAAWVVFLSPKDKDGRPTDRSLEVVLPD